LNETTKYYIPEGCILDDLCSRSPYPDWPVIRRLPQAFFKVVNRVERTAVCSSLSYAMLKIVDFQSFKLRCLNSG